MKVYQLGLLKSLQWKKLCRLDSSTLTEYKMWPIWIASRLWLSQTSDLSIFLAHRGKLEKYILLLKKLFTCCISAHFLQSAIFYKTKESTDHLNCMCVYECMCVRVCVRTWLFCTGFEWDINNPSKIIVHDPMSRRASCRPYLWYFISERNWDAPQ